MTASHAAVEAALAQIWSEVLCVPRVGAEDDFFSLGGDSLLSIQIVSRAKSRGISLDYKMVFQNPTIRKLAASVEARRAPAPERVIGAEVALTPIQLRFFATAGTDVSHWNQWALLELRGPVRLHDLHASVRQLLEVHDVLRLSFRLEEGVWRQRYMPLPARLPVEYVHIAPAQGSTCEEQLELLIREVNCRLDPEKGELIRFVYGDCGVAQSSKLLIVAHHLIMDNVSFHILVHDLDTCLSQCAAGCLPQLESNSCTYQAWSKTLLNSARAGTFAAESDYWLAQAQTAPDGLPCDYADALDQNTYGLMRSCSISLSEETTRAVVYKLPALLGCSVNSVLLDALSRALRESFGLEEAVIDIESHGRRWIDDSIDLSKATGWYTSIFPQRISSASGRSAYERTRMIDRQLRAVPHGGLGYGVLRYLAHTNGGRLGGLPEARIGFNYLGQIARGSQGMGVLDATHLRVGASHSGNLRRSHLLLIEGAVTAGTLALQCFYGSRFHREGTIRRFLRRMQSSLNAHLATVAAGFRRSFRRFILDQPQPLEIGAVLDGISVLHPLSGIQTSILFQHLAGEAGVPPYVVQVSCALCGRFNLDAFQQAWQRVVARHESLRTSFHWLELDAPVQAVHRELCVPVKMLDWRGQDAASQGVGLTSLLRADRSAPFVLDGAAPLMRITLVRVADERTFCIWTHHHIQLDGWSQIVVLRELFQHYAALLAGETLALPAPPTLGEYFHALERFPAEAAQRYWREYLKGFIQPTPIAAHAGLVADRDAHEDYREQHIDIDTLTSEAAYEFARASSLTVQTLVRVAWGLWLALHGGRDDVLFGTIVAGRNCDLPCGDHLVGTLINTIPVRMRFDQDVSLIEWLRAAQDGQAASHAYELLPLAQIVKLAQTDRDRLLFESILVFENLPGDYAQLAALAGFRLEELNFAIRENYPLVVSVRPARNLAVRISYRAAHVDARIEHLGAFLGLALTAMIRHKDQPLKQLTRAVRDSYFG